MASSLRRTRGPRTAAREWTPSRESHSKSKVTYFSLVASSLQICTGILSREWLPERMLSWHSQDMEHSCTAKKSRISYKWQCGLDSTAVSSAADCVVQPPLGPNLLSENYERTKICSRSAPERRKRARKYCQMPRNFWNVEVKPRRQCYIEHSRS